jgi:hypothetical protein
LPENRGRRMPCEALAKQGIWLGWRRLPPPMFGKIDAAGARQKRGMSSANSNVRASKMFRRVVGPPYLTPLQKLLPLKLPAFYPVAFAFYL